MYKVGIVGAGFVGRRRAAVAKAHPETEVALVYDMQEEVAASVVGACGGGVADSWEALVATDLDIVVVATTHDALAEISTAAPLLAQHTSTTTASSVGNGTKSAPPVAQYTEA